MKHSGLDPTKFGARYQAQISSQIHANPKDRSEVQDTKPERDEKKPLGSAAQREEKSLRRPLVRFTGYRVKPLDPDNFAGSCKDLLDGLRHAGLLYGDEPWKIRYITEQEKVRHFRSERTEIEIIY